MKILVIDDTEMNRKSAEMAFLDHELTVVDSYDAAVEVLEKNNYDVVLSDLLMPASHNMLGPEGMKYAGELMPVGFALALFAARQGTKYVAVVTATSHHDHPASAMLDLLDSSTPAFVINGAVVGFSNHNMSPVEGTVCPVCHGGEKMGNCNPCWGTGNMMGKNWKAALSEVMRKT